MQPLDEYRIETPEQIDLGLELAGLGTRFFGQFIDWLIKSLVTFFIWFIAIILLAFLGIDTDRAIKGGYQAVLVLGIVLTFLIWLGYDILFEARSNGQTPGKRYAGARVLRDTGAPIDFSAAAIRNLLGIADFMPLAYLCGALLILLTPKRQRLGDLAAGTIVVRDREADSIPVDPQRVMEQFTGNQLKLTPTQLAVFTTEDKQVIRSFFQRFKTMNDEQRGALALRLARTYSSRVPEPLEHINSSEEAIEFLADLARQLDQSFRLGY